MDRIETFKALRRKAWAMIASPCTIEEYHHWTRVAEECTAAIYLLSSATA